MIIGSKRVNPTLNQQDQYRRLLSAGLNAILQYFFDCVAAETHGMKFMRTNVFKQIADSCVMQRGQFDTELTLRALRAGLWVAEVPIPYLEKRKQRNFMFRKIGQNVFDLVRFRKVMDKVEYCGNVKYKRFCREDLDRSEFKKNKSRCSVDFSLENINNKKED